MEILRRYAPQNDMLIQMSTEPSGLSQRSIVGNQHDVSQLTSGGTGVYVQQRSGKTYIIVAFDDVTIRPG